MPKLTVVVTTYNRPGYLAECLESIAAQTFQDFSLVVLDNASTEDYSPVLERYESLGFEYIRNPENIGAVGNIEKARAIGARSEFHIVFHDDDLMHPHMLGVEIACLESHPSLAWVATGCAPFTDGVRPEFPEFDDPASRLQIYASVADLVRALLGHSSLNFGSVMFRSALTSDIPFRREEFEIVADRVLLADIASRAPSAFLPDPLVLYRHHDAQDSHNPIFRESHALALMRYYKAALPRPLQAADARLLRRHATNYLLHARSVVAPPHRMPMMELLASARADGLFSWASLDGQGTAALARLAGMGGPFDAVRPILGRLRRSLRR